MLDDIQKILKSKNVKTKITLKTTFKDIGLDSLDLMDLIILVEDKFEVHIPDDKLLELENVEDLIGIIKELQK